MNKKELLSELGKLIAIWQNNIERYNKVTKKPLKYHYGRGKLEAAIEFRKLSEMLNDSLEDKIEQTKDEIYWLSEDVRSLRNEIEGMKFKV